jgi:hypothetical protein
VSKAESPQAELIAHIGGNHLRIFPNTVFLLYSFPMNQFVPLNQLTFDEIQGEKYLVVD